MKDPSRNVSVSKFVLVEFALFIITIMTNLKIMQKLKQLLTSKKFWTLVAALVAAFAAFFTTSCATSTTLTVRGAQVDSLDFNRTVQFKMKK